MTDHSDLTITHTVQGAYVTRGGTVTGPFTDQQLQAQFLDEGEER